MSLASVSYTHLYNDGQTMREIRDWLNEKGIKNKRGGPMSFNVIQHMLSNRRYIGELKYRDILIPDAIPPIVSVEIFNEVQEKMLKNKKAPARRKAEDDYLLTTCLLYTSHGAAQGVAMGFGGVIFHTFGIARCKIGHGKTAVVGFAVETAVNLVMAAVAGGRGGDGSGCLLYTSGGLLLSPRFPTRRNVYREADCPLSFLFYMAVSL